MWCFLPHSRLLQKDKNNLEALRMLTFPSLGRHQRETITEVKFKQYELTWETDYTITHCHTTNCEGWLFSWCVYGQTGYPFSFLVVSEPALKSHQQLGHPRASQPRAFLQDVLRFHMGGKTCLMVCNKHIFYIKDTGYTSEEMSNPFTSPL